jgi:hypothetical protein
MGDNKGCCSGLSGTHLSLYQGFVLAIPILITFALLFLFLLVCLRRQYLIQAETSHLRRNLRGQGGFIIPRTGLFTSNGMQQKGGLNKSIRDELPVIIFNEKLRTATADNQCAVCLGDYQKDEVLRQLPVCSHIFHKDCVDEWLVKNSSCPLCRTLLFQQEILLTMERPLHCPPWQLQLPSTTHTTELLILPRTNSNSNSTAAEESNTIPTGEIRHLPHLHTEEMLQEESVAGEHRIQIDCS